MVLFTRATPTSGAGTQPFARREPMTTRGLMSATPPPRGHRPELFIGKNAARGAARADEQKGHDMTDVSRRQLLAGAAGLVSSNGVGCAGAAAVITAAFALATNPRRARTTTPGRFTVTAILWNLPSSDGARKPRT